LQRAPDVLRHELGEAVGCLEDVERQQPRVEAEAELDT
jgi:hypothetical protein